MEFAVAVAVFLPWALLIWLAVHHRKSSRARKKTIADTRQQLENVTDSLSRREERAENESREFAQKLERIEKEKEALSQKVKGLNTAVSNHFEKIADIAKAIPEVTGNIIEIPELDPSENRENTIWIYWDSGLNSAPDIVLHSYKLWVEKNPDFQVVFLDDEKLKSIVGFDFAADANCFPFVKLTKASFSDLLRVYLLYRFGGVWVDSTTLCVEPISTWLPKEQRDLFCFRQPPDHPDRQLVSWFLASRQGHPVIRELLEEILRFLGKERNGLATVNMPVLHNAIANKRDDLVSREGTGFDFLSYCEDRNVIPYFWMFYLWNEVMKNNQDAKRELDNKINSYCQPYAEWDEFRSSKVAKQTRKNTNNKDLEKKTIYLLKNSTPKARLSFLHIPKAAGSSIENAALKRGIFWGRFDRTLERNELGVSRWHYPQKTLFKGFCVIRNPYERVISQFRHEHETNDYDENKLNAWVEKKFELLRANPNLSDGHFIPQVNFFKFCDFAVDFGRLDAQLQSLLSEFGVSDFTIGRNFGGAVQDQKRRNSTYKHLGIEHLSKSSVDIMGAYYKDDCDLYETVASSPDFLT